jgi:hypothetical protein
MPINILCIGDVVGKPGRALLAEHLERLIAEKRIECVVCNAENAAGGSGLTPQIFKKLLHYGVDVVTLGDHAYKKLQIVPELHSSDRIVRPANLAPVAAGREWTVVPTKSGLHKVAVTILLGQTFMRNADSPWQKADQVLAQMPADAKLRVVDFHAEATSEKIAMGWHLNGRATIVFGTHTHVPTADARVLDGGTAYISDVGMTGPYDGVLGRRKDRVLHALTTSMPAPFEVARDDPRLCGIIVTADPDTGKALAVERLEVAGKSIEGAIYDGDDATKSGFYRD